MPALISASIVARAFSRRLRLAGVSLSAVGVAMIFVQAYLIRLVLPSWGPVRTAVVYQVPLLVAVDSVRGNFGFPGAVFW